MYNPTIRPRASVALLAVGSILFLALAALQLQQRGGIGPARTIVSRTGYSPRTSEEALALLEAAAALLPPGSRVAFIDTAKRGSDWLYFAVATGQLPRQQVILPESLSGEGAPEFIIVLHGGFVAGQYRETWRSAQGTIYARR